MLSSASIASSFISAPDLEAIVASVKFLLGLVEQRLNVALSS
jgi:hypothetical protein